MSESERLHQLTANGSIHRTLLLSWTQARKLSVQKMSENAVMTTLASVV